MIIGSLKLNQVSKVAHSAATFVFHSSFQSRVHNVVLSAYLKAGRAGTPHASLEWQLEVLALLQCMLLLRQLFPILLLLLLLLMLLGSGGSR